MDSHTRRTLVVSVMSALTLIALPSVGAQLDDYRAIQGMLNELGLGAGPEDGQWGPASRRAMRTFQASKGLPDTGTPDPATLAALRAQLGLPAICSIGLELEPGQGCDVPGAGTFSVRADGCVDEMPSFPDGRFRLSIGRMSSTSTGGKRQSCISGHLGIGPFRASAISGTARWRIDALPGATPEHEEEASQEVQRAEEARKLLFASIAAGEPAGVVRAMEDGAGVNDLVDGSDLKGASALIIAASHGNAEIIRMLVDAGASVNHVLPEQGSFSEISAGMSALYVAVKKEYPEIVRLLLDAGANVNHVLPEQGFRSRDMNGASALITAVLLGNAEISRILVDAGANVNHVLPEQDVRYHTNTGASALIFAAARGDEEIVRLLVAAGANVQYQIAEGSNAGLTALRAASAKNHTAIVEFLNHSSSVNEQSLTERFQVSDNEIKARLTNHVRPQYPPLLRQIRVQGTVKLSAVVAKDGTVQSLKALSGPRLLVPVAMDAVKQWRYRPTLVNGEAVEVVRNVDIEFTLSDTRSPPRRTAP